MIFGLDTTRKRWITILLMPLSFFFSTGRTIFIPVSLVIIYAGTLRIVEELNTKGEDCRPGADLPYWYRLDKP